MKNDQKGDNPEDGTKKKTNRGGKMIKVPDKSSFHNPIKLRQR